MIHTNQHAALYARFSSDNQRSESIDAQIRAMTTYCKQRNIVIVDTYIDEAKSATTDKRPSFQQMIADSRSHAFDIVLVHKLDRFARNRYDSAVYKRELKKNGVTVYSVLENLDDSPESIIMESVLEGMSEYYSQNLAREVMKGMKETALQCKHTGGIPPLGYDIDPASKKLVVNPREAEAVWLIFDMYSKGCGYTEILTALRLAGYATKRGEEFRKNSLYGILTNQKYKGVFTYNRIPKRGKDGKRNCHQCKSPEELVMIDGGCPPIVAPEVYDAVQKRMEANKHSGGKGNAKTVYLLSGKVFCRECGRAMCGNPRHYGNGRPSSYIYRCPSPRHICNGKDINRDYLERYYIGLLEAYILNPQSLHELAGKIASSQGNAMTELAEKKAEIDQRLDNTLTAIQNLTAAVEAGRYSPSLAERLSQLEAEKAAIEAEARNAALQDPCAQATINPEYILAEYARVKHNPASPEYKEFVQSFLDLIEVGRYMVRFFLKTGLDACPDLDTIIEVRHQTIHEIGKLGYSFHHSA